MQFLALEPLGGDAAEADDKVFQPILEVLGPESECFPGLGYGIGHADNGPSEFRIDRAIQFGKVAFRAFLNRDSENLGGGRDIGKALPLEAIPHD